MTPDGWSRVRLSEVADQRTEKSVPIETDTRPYVALEHLAQGSPTLLGWSKAGTAASVKTTFRAGDVLFGKLRSYLRKAAPAPFDGLCSTDILPLFGRSTLDTCYLAQLAQWHPLQQHAVATSSGTKMPRTSWSQLGTFQFSLPPLPEQRKIAAILSSVDDAIEKAQAVIDQIQVVKRGLLQELLTRGLPGQHKRFKKTVIGEIPEDWVVSPIGDLGQEGRPAVKAGPFGSSLKKSYYVSEGYRVYGQEQVLAGDLSVGNYYVDEGRYRLLRSCEVRPGDVLLSLVGTFGEAIVVPRGVEPGIINPRLLRISLDPRLILPDFTCYWLRCGKTQRLLAAAAQGGTMGVLNAGIVRRLSLARPPLGEQAAIVATLRALDRRLDSETAAKASALRLKSALMSVLLTGELRVAPDPEPE